MSRRALSCLIGCKATWRCVSPPDMGGRAFSWFIHPAMQAPKVNTPSTGLGVGWGRKTMRKLGLPEQSQQNLRPLIGQAQCLDTKLLTDLQRLKR